MRLQKYLSRAGVASRREGERLISEGRVSIDGRIVTELGTRVVPGEQSVHVDGVPIRPRELRWVALYKPVGHVTSRKDPQGRPTIYELLPELYAELFHVGRLDLLSEGLLILTNDGELAHRLLHPSFQIPRRYEVEVPGPLDRAAAHRLESGVELEDGTARARDIEITAGPSGVTVVRMTLHEGRNREVRRMLAALDCEVARLVRISYGPIALGALGPGEWRELGAAEVRVLRSAVELGEPIGDT
jgi:pseudouridine synthase